MEHYGTWTMRTKRLTLRRFLPEDVLPMYHNWAKDPEVTQYLTWYPHANVGETRKIVTEWCSKYANDDFYQWVIEYDDQPIGSIGLHFNHDGDLELGYCMGRKWWGRGIMTEAAQKVVQYVFVNLRADKLVSCHVRENVGSGRVMQKCGMEYTCTKPIIPKGQEVAVGIFFQITKERYQELHGDMLV